MFNGLLIGLWGKQVQVRGRVILEIVCGEGTDAKAIYISYLIVETMSSYNIIIGWPTINAIEAYISIMYLVLKYPQLWGWVSTIREDQKIAQECYKNNLVTERKSLALIGAPFRKFQMKTLIVGILY